jgi:hypothetical protein
MRVVLTASQIAQPNMQRHSGCALVVAREVDADPGDVSGECGVDAYPHCQYSVCALSSLYRGTGVGKHTNNSNKNPKIHNPRNPTIRRGEHNNKPNGDKRHEKQNKRRALLISV